MRMNLDPALWENGNFPTMDQYRQILKRGKMLFNLDIESYINDASKEPADMTGRTCNILYATAMKGYGRTGTQGFKGPASNELLKEYIPSYREQFASLHSMGIPVIIYQNENNFDREAFSVDKAASMYAQLDPFTWAFSNEGRQFACINKQAWRDHLVERLLLRVGKTGADGVFMDNNTPFIHCRCSSCRELYRSRFGASLYDDMGSPETYLADMRVFDYIGHSQVPKDLVRVDDKNLMRYLEWRIERLVDFHNELRDRLEKTLGRKLIFTSNGHVGIAEQSAVMIKSCFDMIFSEDGYSAPPVSNGFSLRLGASIAGRDRCTFVITRTVESAPVAGMVQILNAEGRAMGGQAEFWDFHIREDEQLLKAHEEMRHFFSKHSKDIYSIEKDHNDIAVIYSWRSDLWSSKAISPAKKTAALLEDMGLPYDVIIAETADRIGDHALLICPDVEIMPDGLFDAIGRYLELGGLVIATGNTALLDEHLDERKSSWPENGLVRFEDRIEEEYFKTRKGLGIHSGYKQPDCALSREIERLLPSPSFAVEGAVPLLSLNHTQLCDGEAYHIVNRYANVFPFIHPIKRKGITVHIRPDRHPGRLLWISPGHSPIEPEVSKHKDHLKVKIPDFDVYGILKIIYEQGEKK